MNYRSTMILRAAMLLSLAAVIANRAQARETVSLDGVWDFATDPGDRGETEQWYQPSATLPSMPLPGYAPTANGKIRVPGIWDNQGYGTESDKVHHNFVGKAWYKRRVEIPRDWTGRRVFLAITGVNRSSKLWVNGHFFGEHIGYLSTQEYDITDYVASGQTATISIQVDSKQHLEVDPLFGGSSIADYVDVVWGGIWGHVVLESRSDAWLSDLFVQPDVSNAGCSASALVNGKAELPDEMKLDVFDKNGHRVAETIAKPASKMVAGRPISVTAPVPNAELWSPDCPTLYTARLSLLRGGKVLDVLESRFGMRQYTIDGPHLLLNGKRLMLRGYGDDHIYPEQMAMPSDKELHLARLRVIKSYGFNHVRHHSTIMPPEYYDACDEVGMISTAEFPIAYADNRFFPGTGELWIRSVHRGTDPAPAIGTYMREWAAAIKRHRNHASILCWVMGNELYNGIPLRFDFQRTARELDPRRFFVDSDGGWSVATGHWLDAEGRPGEAILDPTNDRDTLDLYFTQFDEISGDPINNTTKYDFVRPKKPVILHEAGNYVTFSRPDLIDEFKHNFKPFWLTAGKAKLEKLGLLQEAGQWAEKSEQLYLLCHKFNLESARRNPYVSGYHWWLFQDYWTSSDGIVDVYFRPKSIPKAAVLKINGEVLLLQKGLARTYRSRNRLDLNLLVSNYSSEPLQGELTWEVKAGDQTIATQQVTVTQVPQGEVVEVAKIGLDLPETISPAKLRITAGLAAGKEQFDNDWSSWLYPAVIGPAKLPAPVFADKAQRKQFVDWDLKPIPEEGPLDEHAVYLTGRCDNRLADAMDRGASVVLLNGVGRFLKSYPMTYRTTWWKAGDSPERNHCGTFVYDHPATRAMAPDGWCDDGWFHLIEGANKYCLETAPARPDVMIRALPSLLMVEDDALLFEVGVGKGVLIVSGLNHRQAKGRSENDWLVARMLERAAGFPQPKAKWPASFLSVAYAAPEGCLPGFDRLTANDGEVSTGPSYRENRAQMFICRQNNVGNLIAWETPPLPRKQAEERVTFVFAGGLGYGAQPTTDGFALEINGKEALRFDVSTPEHWKSADERVDLKLVVRRTESGGQDQFGLFYLKVPRDLLQPGEPCLLGVRSLGKGSQRWFCLNPYYDAK